MQLHQWHLKCSLSCISNVHRIRPGGFLVYKAVWLIHKYEDVLLQQLC